MHETKEKEQLVLDLLRIIKKNLEKESKFQPIREKSIGHPDYPSIMPDLTGLA
jgi:hypothetical protein